MAEGISATTWAPRRSPPIPTTPRTPWTRSFLEDAAHGSLPAVAWIDPNFSNFNPIGFQPNDDHAPADIRDGQQFVLAIYHALASGPQWEKTLLIIFYDEHGGFFDHVPPPPAPDDDPRMFGRYGVRVPALIVSPWTEPGVVSHTLFDHTSVIKTILLRFCPNALGQPAGSRRSGWVHRGGHPHPVGTRVAQAHDLGGTADPRDTPASPGPVRAHRGRRGPGRRQAQRRSHRAGRARPPALHRPPAPHGRRQQGAAQARAPRRPAVTKRVLPGAGSPAPRRPGRRPRARRPRG